MAEVLYRSIGLAGSEVALSRMPFVLERPGIRALLLTHAALPDFQEEREPVREALYDSLRGGAYEARSPGVLAGTDRAKALARADHATGARAGGNADDDALKPAKPRTRYGHIDLQALAVVS